ncbi:MAG: glutathione S-transferase family protein, partial [Halioglobus sp.]
YPARLIQERATSVYRWVERMNRADQDAPEYFDAGSDFLPDDEVPETLLPVLRVLAEDFVPETRAAAEFINAWLEGNQPEAGTQAVGRLAQSLGNAKFTLRGEAISALVQPYRFYMLQRVQDIYTALAPEAKIDVDQLLENCGMTEILEATLDRRIGRADNLEVWEA